MPPKVIITFEGILLSIHKIVLHLMVDSTVSILCGEGSDPVGIRKNLAQSAV